jgi:hypothetical protein
MDSLGVIKHPVSTAYDYYGALIQLSHEPPAFRLLRVLLKDNELTDAIANLSVSDNVHLHLSNSSTLISTNRLSAHITDRTREIKEACLRKVQVECESSDALPATDAIPSLARQRTRQFAAVSVLPGGNNEFLIFVHSFYGTQQEAKRHLAQELEVIVYPLPVHIVSMYEWNAAPAFNNDVSPYARPILKPRRTHGKKNSRPSSDTKNSREALQISA